MSSSFPQDTQDNLLDSITHTLSDRHFLDTKTECSICYENDVLPTVQIIVCGHTFHKACIAKWVNHLQSEGKAATCPLDRSRLFSEGFLEHLEHDYERDDEGLVDDEAWTSSDDEALQQERIEYEEQQLREDEELAQGHTEYQALLYEDREASELQILLVQQRIRDLQRALCSAEDRREERSILQDLEAAMAVEAELQNNSV